MNSDSVVQFDRVWKQFTIGETHDSIASLLASSVARIFHPNKKVQSKRKTFWALQDASFAIPRGEALGIIGPNGSGKSTALKILAGILRPNRGHVRVVGRLAALIEVGAGFHGDLTGKENIFLNGAILGMSRAEIRKKLDEIIAFAGIERFIDMPVKRYSSGMYARLGFSIAAHVDPDVLLVDEVLSVGDAVFRLRCIERMKELIEQGVTLVFVTHNLDQMQSICKNAIVLDGGQAVFSGSARDAVGEYLQAMSRSYTNHTTDVSQQKTLENAPVKLLGLHFLNERGEKLVWCRADQPVRVRLRLECSARIDQAVVELNMRANLSNNLVSINSGRSCIPIQLERGTQTVILHIASLPVCGGQYFWNARVWNQNTGATELDTSFRYPLVIDDAGQATGLLCIDHRWLNQKPNDSQTVEGLEVRHLVDDLEHREEVHAS